MIKRFGILAPALAFGVLLAACGEHDDEPDAGGEPEPLSGVEAASFGDDGSMFSFEMPSLYWQGSILRGELAVESGCLGVRSDDLERFVPVVFPHGYGFTEQDGEDVLHGIGGHVVVSIGEHLSIGGGLDRHQDDYTTDRIRGDCNADEIWLASNHVDSIDEATDQEPELSGDPTVFFPRWTDEPDDGGRMTGYLEQEYGSLWLYLEIGVMGQQLVWPDDYSLEADGQDVVVLDGDGNRLASTGDLIHISGSMEDGSVEEYPIPGGADPYQFHVRDIEIIAAAGEPVPDHPAIASDAPIEQRIVGILRRNLWHMERDRFAEIYASDSPASEYVVQMTDGDEEAVLQYLENPDLHNLIEVHQADRSHEEILRAQRMAMDMLSELGLRVEAGTNVWENRAEVYTADPELVEAALEDAGIVLPESVEIVDHEDM